MFQMSTDWMSEKKHGKKIKLFILFKPFELVLFSKSAFVKYYLIVFQPIANEAHNTKQFAK